MSGLKELWTKGNLTSIMLSAGLSVISLSLGSVKQVAAAKNGFMSLKGKLLLALFSLLSLFVRLAAILLFFAPPLGLANLLMHWKMGQMKAEPTKVFDYVDGNKTKLEQVWNRTENYTEYTAASLQTFYIVFIVMVVVHCGVVFAIKSRFAAGFPSGDNSCDNLFHVLAQIFIPSIFVDWDVEELSGSFKH